VLSVGGSIKHSYIQEPHILIATNKPRNGRLQLLQKIPLIICEDRNIEKHHELDSRIMIRSRHCFQAATAVSRCCNLGGINVAIFCWWQ